MQQLSEEQWLRYVATMQPKPPMPWYNMRAMSEADLKAMYAYIHSLGPAGAPMPVDDRLALHSLVTRAVARAAAK